MDTEWGFAYKTHFHEWGFAYKTHFHEWGFALDLAFNNWGFAKKHGFLLCSKSQDYKNRI